MDSITDRLDMTIVVRWDVKQHSYKQTENELPHDKTNKMPCAPSKDSD